MNIESITAFVSVGISLVNSLAVAGVYLRYMRSARNVFNLLRADEHGNVEILDPWK
ncbi:hypothetical protein ACKUB1_09700 [Methanospirillum stamsii]|uniref:hypothetical protein n=1 Tax=Methanospirillum stamsii TaxID=1277351 RepID=UPI0015E865CE|nr:hypothetical protein [Methanospirillum stamsii]